MSYKIVSVLVLALVSYIPRAFPIAFMNKKIENRFIKSFLYYVPYAVLSALAFPAVFYACGNVYLALIGTATAILLAYFNQELYIVALVSVIVVFGFSFLFNC